MAGKRLQDREERERLDRAASMPHRKHAGDNRLDARLASPLGRLFFSGEITQPQYEAGIRYGLIGLRWLQSIDAPEPYGIELGPLDEDLCFRRKLAYAQVRTIVRDVSVCCARVVDRIAIHEQEPRSDFELAILRLGLRALTGEKINKQNLAAA